MAGSWRPRLTAIVLVAGPRKRPSQLRSFVELTIAWNRISGVHDIGSTGQVIPLFIGLGLLMTVIWTLVRKKEVGS